MQPQSQPSSHSQQLTQSWPLQAQRLFSVKGISQDAQSILFKLIISKISANAKTLRDFFPQNQGFPDEIVPARKSQPKT